MPSWLVRIWELLKWTETAGEPPKGKPWSQKLTKCGKVKWEWTRQAKLPFRNTNRIFTEVTNLPALQSGHPIIIQAAASGFSIVGILNQYDVFRFLSPVSFYSWKCSRAKHRYDIYNWELFAIASILNQVRHYLENTSYKVLLRCNHKNLEYFPPSKGLSRRPAGWSEIFSPDEFVIIYMKRSTNPANSSSSRPDNKMGYEWPFARQLATVAVEPYDKLMRTIIVAQPSDPCTVNVLANLVHWPMIDHTETANKESQSEGTEGHLTYEGGYTFNRPNLYAEKW